ncbi:hypothetical protein DL89DRAFT_43219 [Linderina pennispora]|uniref:Transmembrane protein n=1 Tax=Linderina pennispora TaxID=61395 RepID=A0A1Y1W2A6_9FUNG|nr:uncharacterized protein DL89DRAFT_43219 [Linderina pennispora]ORX67386.1 hypothetical protein DL89DRAFT_43219 [Linderina pennispora]
MTMPTSASTPRGAGTARTNAPNPLWEQSPPTRRKRFSLQTRHNNNSKRCVHGVVGYHVCFTRIRSPVRSWMNAFLCIIFLLWNGLFMLFHFYCVDNSP